jgi:aryl-alcohol dehydrogenase-like predicted oxidoreductase
MASLAIAWCAYNTNVSTVILGATKASQLTENLKALEVLPLLSKAVMEKIDGVLQNKPVLPEW